MARYSKTLMEHFNSPHNAGKMEHPDVAGKASVRNRAPYMTIYLKVRDDVVTRAMFTTFGCGASIAAGSALTEMVTGQPVQGCLAIEESHVVEALDGMPHEKLFCAGLAVKALRDALTKLNAG